LSALKQFKKFIQQPNLGNFIHFALSSHSIIINGAEHSIITFNKVSGVIFEYIFGTIFYFISIPAAGCWPDRAPLVVVVRSICRF
jgi:hypothetical protein